MTISNQIYDEKYQFVKAESHLTAVIDNSIDGIITIDQDGKIFLFNSTSEELFGYSASEAAQKNIKDLMPELFKGFHNGHIRSLWDKSHVIKIGSIIEIDAIRKNNTSFPANLIFSEFWIENERYFSVKVKNVSEKKLTEAQKLHEIAFDHVKEGIIGIDLEGKITFINAIGASLLGYEPEKLKGRPFNSTIYHLKTISNRNSDQENIILDVIKDGKEKNINDQIFLDKYGSFISVDLKVSPVENEDEILGVIISFDSFPH